MKDRSYSSDDYGKQHPRYKFFLNGGDRIFRKAGAFRASGVRNSSCRPLHGDGDSSRRINFTEYPKYFDGIFRSDNMPEPVAAVRVIVNFLLRKHFGRYGTEVFIVLICSILCSVWRGTAVLCQRQGFVK